MAEEATTSAAAPAPAPVGETPPPVAGATALAPTPLALLQQIGTAAATAVEGAAERVVPAFDAASKAMAPALDKATKAAEDAAKAVGTAATEAAGRVAQAATGAAGRVGEFAAPVVDKARAQIGDAVEGVKKIIPPGVSTAAQTAANSVESAATAFGGWFTRAAASLVGVSQSNVLLVLGLEGAGKTTVIEKVRELAQRSGAKGVPDNAEPTSETAELNGLILVAHRAGSESLSAWLPKGAMEGSGVRGVVLVVDATATASFPQARDALREALAVLCAPGAAMSKGGAVLVMANKSDLPNAAKAEELAGALGLQSLPNPWVLWNVQPTTATIADGLADGLEWVSQTINL